MPILLLIRHGENDFIKKGILIGNTPGVPLNAHGQEQAASLAEALKSLPIRAIYSSSLQRALETARPLAMALGKRIRVRPGLMDTKVGIWAGRELKELRMLPEWKKLQESPSGFRFPGGDSIVELQERLVSEIEAIRKAHRQRELVAVYFHADPIKLVIAHYLGMPLDHFQKLGVNTGSMAVLVVDKAGARLEGLNLKPPFQWEHTGPPHHPKDKELPSNGK